MKLRTLEMRYKELNTPFKVAVKQARGLKQAMHDVDDRERFIRFEKIKCKILKIWVL
jgi:hypothetical protein